MARLGGTVTGIDASEKNINVAKLHSKKNNLTYKTCDGKIFSVHVAYKSSLDGYSKKLFDPFCRADKITYTIPGTTNEIHTTVAQLNFIRWCIKNNIIDYIKDHKLQLFNKRAS